MSNITNISIGAARTYYKRSEYIIQKKSSRSTWIHVPDAGYIFIGGTRSRVEPQMIHDKWGKGYAFFSDLGDYRHIDTSMYDIIRWKGEDLVVPKFIQTEG